MNGAANIVPMMQISWRGKDEVVAISEAVALRDAINDAIGETETPLKRVMRMVAKHFNITVAEMCADNKFQRTTWPRQVAMKLAHDLTGSGLSMIGREFHRDHGTVTHAIKVVKERVDTNPAERLKFLRLRREVNMELGKMTTLSAHDGKWK